MPRFYVEKDGEWNIFSTITDDFVFDEFVCLDALKARLLYERYKELTEDIDSLLTDKPSVNVMDYEEAMKRRKEQTMKKYIDTEWLENNAKEYSLGYYEEDEWATPLNVLDSAPSIDIVRCRECKYASDDGTYGCMCEHFNDTSDAYHRMWSDDFCSRGERNRSEKPNNCEHITEDGVTCAKYPACDDCLDNPLNKVKGSERLVKGKDEPQTGKE